MSWEIEVYSPGPPITFDPATVAWAAAVVANGGTVSFGREIIVNNLIVGLKSDGIWTLLDRLWILAAENQTSGLVDLIANTLASNVSTSFTTDRGFTGNDGLTDWVDTTVKLNVGSGYTLNTCHVSAWSATNNTQSGSNNFLCGCDDNANNTRIGNQTSSGITGDTNDSTGGHGFAGTLQGHWLVNRTGASLEDIYQNASVFASPNGTAGTLPSSKNVGICADNTFGSGPTFSTAQTVAMCGWGASLTGTQVTNFYNRLRTYMTAVGVP